MLTEIDLEKYSDADLYMLNDRIKRIIYERREVQELAIMSKINIGDQVGFQDKKGRTVSGTVMEKFTSSVGVHSHSVRGKPVNYEVTALAITHFNEDRGSHIPEEFRKGPNQSGKLWQ